MSQYPVLKVNESTTEQQVYDAVVTHLKHQNARSQCDGPTGGCKYRLGDLACAVGCLLTDDQAWNCDNDPRSSAASVELFKRHAPELVRFVDLLRMLQSAHDHNDPGRQLRNTLEVVARQRHLTNKVLDGFVV